MQRDHDKRPGKTPARKMTPDGLEEQSENIGDASRESFNLRTERSDTAPGRGAPRDSPASVHSTISRHKAQARRFTEHAAKPADAVSPDDNQPIQRGSGNTPADVRPWNFQEPEPLRDSGHPIKDTDGLPPGQNAGLEHAAPRDAPASVHSTISRHKEQARRFTEHAAKPADAVSPVHDAAQDSERISEQTQSQEVLPDGSATARDAPLRHEHAPRAQSERPGRIRFGGSSPAPKDAPRRKPTLSPDAAKYTPPGATDKPDSTAAPDGSKEGAHKKTGKPDEPKSDGGETPAAEDAPVAEDSATAEDSQPSADEAPGTQDAPSSDKKPGTKHGTERSHSKKPGKLRFSDDEAPPSTRDAPPESQTPSKKPDKARHKAERSEQKLDKARKNLPKKRSVRVDKIVDEKSGKIKKKLHFEETVKSRHEQLKGPLVTRPVKAGANAAIVNAHRKIYQVEHENIGTQAAHKGEMLIEGGMRGVYRMHKTAPYRRVEKLERRTTKLNIKTSYQQALNDNPKLKNSIFSRAAQKRKTKKDYAKAARETKKAAQRAKKAGDAVGKVGQAIVRTVARHPVVFGVIGVLFLLIAIISSLFTSCFNMGSGIGGAITATTYLAQDADVDNAELYYTEWETDLQMRIGRTESDFPGYDEYRYQADNIGHNPYELMAFLTATYGEFGYINIEAVLREIFAEQYQLTFTPSVETKYSDPTDADEDGDYEPYDRNVLTVTLTSRSFTDVITPRMSAEQLQQYGLLMRSKGNRRYAGSPFDFNWLPYVTGYYGYRIHPTTGAKDYHMGIDIGVPIGTDIHAAHAGTVSAGYDAGGYGYRITITGADGLVTNYAHCDSFVVSDGQTVNAGDVIAKSGNTGNSTGPHLHFEVIKNGRYLNPIYFSKTNDTGSLPVYGYAGSPMDGGS